MVSSTRSPRKWDSPMLLASPSNSTPSARFAVDTASGLKTRVWVEEVIGRRLPEGDFAAGFKDGVGLCELLNVFKPGTIPKIETSKSPFHQMANISCFLKAVRALGVREQVLFETLVRSYKRDLLPPSSVDSIIISCKTQNALPTFLEKTSEGRSFVTSSPINICRRRCPAPADLRNINTSLSLHVCTELQRCITEGCTHTHKHTPCVLCPAGQRSERTAVVAICSCITFFFSSPRTRNVPWISRVYDFSGADAPPGHRGRVCVSPSQQ